VNEREPSQGNRTISSSSNFRAPIQHHAQRRRTRTIARDLLADRLQSLSFIIRQFALDCRNMRLLHRLGLKPSNRAAVDFAGRRHGLRKWRGDCARRKRHESASAPVIPHPQLSSAGRESPRNLSRVIHRALHVGSIRAAECGQCHTR
jgi:hypothetical protein